jgi:hypothetical protein
METLFMATYPDTYRNHRSYRISLQATVPGSSTHNWGNQAESILITATGLSQTKEKRLKTMKRFRRFTDGNSGNLR